MKKIVVNRCFGGFGISTEGYEWLLANGIPEWSPTNPDGSDAGEMPDDEPGITKFQDQKYKSLMGEYYDNFTREQRDHPLLVRMVEELGTEKASGSCAQLSVTEIPDDVKWTIEEYDGLEHIAEEHRTW